MKFHPEHTWARQEDSLVVIGISDLAQRELSDVEYVDLPEPGARLTQGMPFGQIESTKVVNDLHAPLSGEVVEVNPDVDETPYIINESPYDRGWLLKVRASDPGEWDSLLTQEEYEARSGS